MPFTNISEKFSLILIYSRWLAKIPALQWNAFKIKERVNHKHKQTELEI